MEPNRETQTCRHDVPVSPTTTGTSFDNLPDDALLTAAQVKPLCGDPSDMTIWRWLRDGKFPKPSKTMHGRRFWRWGDVREWLKAA